MESGQEGGEIREWDGRGIQIEEEVRKNCWKQERKKGSNMKRKRRKRRRRIEMIWKMKRKMTSHELGMWVGKRGWRGKWKTRRRNVRSWLERTKEVDYLEQWEIEREAAKIGCAYIWPQVRREAREEQRLRSIIDNLNRNFGEVGIWWHEKQVVWRNNWIENVH